MSSTHSQPFAIVSRWYWFYLCCSLVVLIPGIFSIVSYGLKPSIDFTGGSTLVLTVDIKNNVTLTKESLQESIGDDITIHSLAKQNANQLDIKTSTITNEQKNKVLQKIEEKIGKPTEKQFETIGPSLGSELITKTAIAIGLCVVLIASYLALRFHSLMFGVAAMLAAVHDLLIVTGIFSILGHLRGIEVDTLFVTALLTILSFSVHDTIVVFDRIREKRKKWVHAPFEEVVDEAVLETLTRSVRNSLAIIITLLSLFLLGGQTTTWFVFALLIGTISGTYSSTFTALPLLIIWEKLTKKYTHKK